MKTINFLVNSSQRNTNYSETENLFAVRKKVNLFLFLLHFFYLIYYSFHYLSLLATVALFVVIHMIILFFLKDQYKNRKLIFFNYFVLLFVNYFYDQYFLETPFVFHYLPLLLSVLLFFDLKNEKKFSFGIITLILLFYVLEFLPISYPFSKNAIHNKQLYFANLFLSIVITLYEIYYIIERFMFFRQDNSSSSENSLAKLIDLAKNNEAEFINYHNAFFPEFNNNLLELAPDLTVTELSTCAYIQLRFSSKEIAQYTKNSIGAIETRKYRIRKKLNTSDEKNLYLLLSSL